MQAGTVLYFLVWAGLFFLMMRFGCGAHIMGHGHHHDGARADKPGGNPRWAPPDKAVDPVCGMTVQTDGAKSAVHDGQVYYFCSQNCREKFEAAPASYAKPTTAAQGEKHHGR
ncbi:MAG: YHS domain-containing protein [Alphaproteobacteria bacterium]|nr:YHS domain-containing protein [Alphaproteobacteria bacterium]